MRGEWPLCLASYPRHTSKCGRSNSAPFPPRPFVKTLTFPIELHQPTHRSLALLPLASWKTETNSLSGDFILRCIYTDLSRRPTIWRKPKERTDCSYDINIVFCDVPSSERSPHFPAGGLNCSWLAKMGYVHAPNGTKREIFSKDWKDWVDRLCPDVAGRAQYLEGMNEEIREKALTAIVRPYLEK
jgi:hypothetical protein